jgi:hypothetical protein
MTDDYLGRLNENVRRLNDLLEDYDESDFSLDSARTTAENIEDLFEEAASEIDELGGRLDMRIAQSRKKDEIIDEMADRIEELEEQESESLDADYILNEIESLLVDYIPEVTELNTEPLDFSHSINYGVNPENFPQGDFSHSINYANSPGEWNEGSGWYSEPSFESVDSSAFDWDEVFSDGFTGEGVYQGEGLHRSGPTVIDASTNITYPGNLFAS